MKVWWLLMSLMACGDDTHHRADASVDVGTSDSSDASPVGCTFAATGLPAYTHGKPASLALADVTGDGRLDIVVANRMDGITSFAGSVGVFAGTGNGTFGTMTEIAVAIGGLSSSMITAVDVNGDPTADLIVGGPVGARVFLGNGDGTFQPEVDYPTDTICSLAVADVNGDAKRDVIAASCTAGGTNVLLGNGDGTFQPKLDVVTATNQRALAVADLNNDTRPDLVVAFGSNPSTVGVLLGNGDGTFQSRVDQTTSQATWALAAADVDNDGNLDLAAANYTPGYADFLRGNGDGTFQPKQLVVGVNSLTIAAADVTDDGKPDLVLGAIGTNGDINVIVGNGDGSFHAPAHHGLMTMLGYDVFAVAIADLDTDGHRDIVATTQDGFGANIVVVLRATCP